MKKLTLVFLGIIAAVVLLVGGFYLGQQISTGNKSPQPAPNPTGTRAQVTSTPSATPTSSMGTIEGSLSFPSEGIPDDMFVCAETLAGAKVACTDDHIENQKYEYGVGYILEVEPSTYYVYSKLPDDDYKAYYTEFVPCGLSTDCDSHEKIEVDVTSGEATTNIDPIDWYDTGPDN